MTQTACQDRQRGCWLGLAVGDALGAAVEFKAPGTFAPVTGYRAGGPHGLGPGEWTDDTSMAWALAESLIHAGWDLNDQASRYLDWYRNGTYSVNGVCFDIGMATRAALSRFAMTRDARTSASTDESASGNGSIMRLAPVPIRYGHLYPDQADELIRLAGESSVPTHRSPICVSACQYLTVLLAALQQGEPRDQVLSASWSGLDIFQRTGGLHPAIKAVALGSFRRKSPLDIRGRGYVVDSLEAALWAFHDAPDFRSAVLQAVNLGEDADTTGAVCGQLAGAMFGATGIPDEWLEGLARRAELESAFERLVKSH